VQGGNQGPGLTGSNGNAGPISGEGLPIDPAAETYKKQVGGTSCLGVKSLKKGQQISRNIPVSATIFAYKSAVFRIQVHRIRIRHFS
jgi:hypothetical protein